MRLQLDTVWVSIWIAGDRTAYQEIDTKLEGGAQPMYDLASALTIKTPHSKELSSSNCK
jgi:hypothetical protein